MTIAITLALDEKDLRIKDDIKNVISQATAHNSSYKDHVNQFFRALYESSGDETIKKTLTSMRYLKRTEEICNRLHACVDRYNTRTKLFMELQEKIKSQEESIDSLLEQYYIENNKDLPPLKPIPIFVKNVWTHGVKKPSGKISYDFVPRLLDLKIDSVITIGSTKIIHIIYTTAVENKRENSFEDMKYGKLNIAIERFN